MSDPQFVVGGPRIPSEIIRELEDERLVLFCGAGISIGTDLPNFRDLTREAINHIYRARGEVPTDPAIDDAFCWGLYDKALNILEDREGRRGDLRRFVARRLTQRLRNAHEQLRMHRALLDLSRLPDLDESERGYRLVTTNYDNRFERAGLSSRWIEAAPRLARPQANHAGYATYLHGRIETKKTKHDPQYRNLVLTSADFGNAYFRDGYAARFVLELFREFTVLFIGYSLNDPVMRYLMDIFATENVESNLGQFRRPYAFVAHDDNDIDLQRQLWNAKHVTPILYSKTNGHELLTGTLETWAHVHRGGSDGRLQIIMNVLGRPFRGDVDADDLKNASWALADRGHRTAKRLGSFDAEANGSDAHISWLGPLLQAEVDDPRDDRRPPHKCRLVEIDEVAFQLCRWAMRHLESKDLVDWAICNQDMLLTNLRSGFFEELTRKLHDSSRSQPVRKPFDLFWQLLVEVAGAHNDIRDWDAFWRIGPGRTPSPDVLRLLIGRLEARLRWPARPFGSGMEDGEEPGRLHNLARYEISDRVCFRDHIRFRDIFCLDANGKGIARKDLSLFVDDLTSLLVAICRLGKRIHAPFAQGLSRHIRESIAPDARNQLELDDWEWLIEALVQSFEAACDEHKELAISTAQRWRMLWRSEDQSLLGRLYIHAVTRTPDLSVNDAIRACLDRPAVLWRYEYEPELLAFLRIRGSDINEDLRNALIGRLLADPLPGLFPEAYSPDDIDRERGQRFAKLRQAGVTLPKRADALAETYLDQNPPSDDPRADEVRYRVVEARWVGPPSGKELAGKKVEEVIDLVDQGRDEYGFKHEEWARAGQIADWLRHDTSRIAETLEVLAERDDVPAGFVDGIFWALRDITSHSEVLTQIDQIASSISRARSIVDQAFNACAGWIKALAVADISDDVFWQLWDVVRDRAPEEDPSNLLDEKPSLNAAINAAGGHLTEAVIDRFWKSQPRVGQGLPTAVSERLGRIVSGTSRLARHARLVCMPPLDALYAVDPGWSEQHLLKHLSWEDNDEDDVASLWTAHLQHGRWSLDLMAAFKSEFLRVLGKRDRLKHEAYRGACWRFAALGIDRPGFLSDSEVRDGFHRMGAEGAHFVLHLFETRLRQSDEPETQWREMIAPWLEKHWPLLEDLRTTDVFTAAAEMLLETGEAFAEALQTLEGLHLIGVIDRRRLVLFRLAGAENADGGDERFPYASRLPSEVCRWLDRILPRDIPGYEWRYLLTVIDAIERALPPGSGTPPCLHQLRERVH